MKSGSRLALLLEDAWITGRFLASLPRVLKHPFTVEQAKRMVEERLCDRENHFLRLMRSRVYACPRSLYRHLLHAAGAEFGDLENLVHREGVEGSLRELLRCGVYLTVDEFKGRTEIRRGNQQWKLDPRELVNPTANVHGISQSSGSGGKRTAVPIDLAAIYDHAVNTLVTLDGHGGACWSHSHWGRPGGTAVTNQVEFALGGNPPKKWFSPVPLTGSGVHPRYRWGAVAMRAAGALVGVTLPPPTLCNLNDPEPLITWAREEVAAGRTPHIWTFASSAVRAANAATAAGGDLEGVCFTAGGEPTTRARKEAVERAGARILPRYGTTETDILAYACVRPEGPDDQHFLHDRFALVQADEAADALDLPPSALMITALLPSAPITLINVSLGDRARLSQSSCGCPMESIGWKTHLSDILSFEKLTVGGTTFFDTELISLLEVHLPKKFGGTLTDYQLVETESSSGEAELQLLAHPQLGAIDTEALRESFYAAVRGQEGLKLVEMYWRSSGFLQIERRVPYRTASGKIPHIHRLLR